MNVWNSNTDAWLCSSGDFSWGEQLWNITGFYHAACRYSGFSRTFFLPLQWQHTVQRYFRVLHRRMMKRPPKKVTMEEARKAHHIRCPLLSQGTSGENGMMTFILEMWTEGSRLNLSRFLDIFFVVVVVVVPQFLGGCQTSTHKESSQLGSRRSGELRPAPPDASPAALLPSHLAPLPGRKKVESTADSPREGLTTGKIVIRIIILPKIQDVISVEARSWLPIRVIHRSARKKKKKSSHISQTLRRRGALPTAQPTGVGDGAGSGVRRRRRRLLCRRRLHPPAPPLKQPPLLQLRGAAHCWMRAGYRRFWRWCWHS